MPNGSTVYLVDNNIFIYAYLRQDHSKAAKAASTLSDIAQIGSGCVSKQVSNEMFARLTRGVQDIRSLSRIEEDVKAIARTWRVWDTTRETVFYAMRGVRQYRLSFWDSLMG